MSQDRTSPTRTIPMTHPSFDADEALRRARTARAVRPARRTLAEMKPSYEQQPVLLLAPHVSYNERCLFCDSWLCPGNCQQFAPAPTAATAPKQVAA
ncbi:hypothetical protein [Streptomyces sp. NPDC047981]|uniref:hypothetical protein n=1 Tax=Streptomyces sp. NPDC047981 TaxID=3154610 RepID=UPI0034447FDA